ncbi:MAG: hypothetical protein K2X76_13660 [Sphingomonas sp.]|nr:hypothetical protein [Sphingomonas sp.]
MTVDGERFITEMLRAIRGEIGEIRTEQLNQSLRLTAVEQRLLGIDTHLAALQHSVDGLKGDMRRVKQRLELVEE